MFEQAASPRRMPPDGAVPLVPPRIVNPPISIQLAPLIWIV
jgi:hypothetical protein